MPRQRVARPHRPLLVGAALLLVTVAGATFAMRGGSATTARTPTTRGAGATVADADAAQRIRPVPAPPLPDVEHAIWHPGRPGRAAVVVDARTGAVLSSRIVMEPVGPSQEPGQVVALTFDDGPHPRWTPTLLQILRDEGVKATFCVVGTMVRRYPELARAIAADGHELCNHTDHHVLKLGERAPAEIAAELRGASDAIREATGRTPRFFRAPGGHVNDALVAEARRQGMRVLGWTVDSEDFRRTSPPELLLRTILRVTPGAVVLLHDGGGDRVATIAMIQRFIHSLRFFGYRAVPLP